MGRKLLPLSCGVALILAIILCVYVLTGPGRMDRAQEAFASQRIEHYTSRYFRFADTVEVDTMDGQTSVSVSFIPEVGSFPIKQEIYANVANHALQITKFYPEATHFEYTVLWDDYTKKEAIRLTIDAEAVAHLEENYTGELVNRNGGLDTHFERVFSSIEETEESRRWHERSDPDS